MISRNPRLIVDFDVAFNKSSERIQNIVDNSSEADFYYTDGYLGYIDVIYPANIFTMYEIKKIHIMLKA